MFLNQGKHSWRFPFCHEAPMASSNRHWWILHLGLVPGRIFAGIHGSLMPTAPNTPGTFGGYSQVNMEVRDDKVTPPECGYHLATIWSNPGPIWTCEWNCETCRFTLELSMEKLLFSFVFLLVIAGPNNVRQLASSGFLRALAHRTMWDRVQHKPKSHQVSMVSSNQRLFGIIIIIINNNHQI